MVINNFYSSQFIVNILGRFTFEFPFRFIRVFKEARNCLIRAFYRIRICGKSGRWPFDEQRFNMQSQCRELGASHAQRGPLSNTLALPQNSTSTVPCIIGSIATNRKHLPRQTIPEIFTLKKIISDSIIVKVQTNQ